MKYLACSFLIIVFIDLCFIVGVAFVTEKETSIAPNKMKFNDVFNFTPEENIHDYCLLNWAWSDKNSLNCAELPQEVLDADLIRLSKTENIIINFLKTRFNSIIQIKTYDIADLELEKFVNTVSVVEICNSFYVLVGFTERINDNWELTSAVYKSKDDLSILYNYETFKSHYYDYEFYPIELSPLFATPFDRILNKLFLIGETFVVYRVFLKRKNKKIKNKNQSGDNSVIES